MSSKVGNKRRLGDAADNATVVKKSPKLVRPSDQSAPKKAKKLNQKNPNAEVKATSEAGEEPQLSKSQIKRKKLKERKQAIMEKIKEEGDVPTKAKKNENKEAASPETKKTNPAAVEKKLKKKREIRDKRKESRKVVGQYKVNEVNESPEILRNRIEEISSRAELTKTAKRKLAVLKKKLAVAEGTVLVKSPPKVVQNPLSESEKRRIRRLEKQKVDPKSTKKVKGKQEIAEKVQKKPGAKKQPVVTEIMEEEEDDSDEEEEDDSDEEEDAPQLNGAGEDLEEPEDEESDEDEEDEEQAENLSEEVDVDSDDDDDNDNDGEDVEENEEAKVGQKKPKAAKQKKKENGGIVEDSKQQPNQGEEKKKRYVLFVGNIPFDATSTELKNHFLTKVSEVSSVRIPLKHDSQTRRGFAYVEVNNDVDYEKGLSLHHTIFNGRRINVEYTMAGSKQVSKRKELVSKNQKLHAMRKAGKLAGSQKHDQKRSVRRFKEKQQKNKQNVA